MTRLGYPATLQQDAARPPKDNEAAALKRAFLTALALTLPVLAVEMGGHLVPAFHHWLPGLVGTGPLNWMQMILTAAVLAGPGRRFFAAGIPALLRGGPEMNSLVALGSVRGRRSCFRRLWCCCPASPRPFPWPTCIRATWCCRRRPSGTPVTAPSPRAGAMPTNPC